MEPEFLDLEAALLYQLAPLLQLPVHIRLLALDRRLWLAGEFGGQFADRYERLLLATGSMPTEQAVQSTLGYDLTEPAFWNRSLDVVERRVSAVPRTRELADRTLTGTHRVAGVGVFAAPSRTRGVGCNRPLVAARSWPMTGPRSG